MLHSLVNRLSELIQLVCYSITRDIIVYFIELGPLLILDDWAPPNLGLPVSHAYLIINHLLLGSLQLSVRHPDGLQATLKVLDRFIFGQFQVARLPTDLLAIRMLL